MKRKKAAGEYLAYLTVKYDIHPDVIFCALLSAEQAGTAKCGPLLVECRGKIDDKTYFLFKEDSNVVAQFPVTEEILARQRNPIRNYMEADMVQNYKSDEPQEPTYSQIGHLKSNSNNVNLKATVVKISKPQYVNTQYGNRIPMAKALLKDETGEINLCLWQEQIDLVSKGDKIDIQNATVRKYNNIAQLTLSKKGTIQTIKKLNTNITPTLVEQVKVQN